MKKYSWIVALLLALSLAFFACDNGSKSDDDDKDKDKEGETELVTIFDMQDASKGKITHGIQELTVGDLDFSDKKNPIAPIVKAGNMLSAGEADDHLGSFKAVDNGGKIALEYVAKASWGPGFDLPNSVFGFLAGDKITVTGKAESAGSIDLAFNKTQGGAQTIVGNQIKEAGDFTVEATLTASDVNAIKANEQKVLRFEDRSQAETTVTIYNIVIVGERPSEIKKLAAPVVTLTATGVEWTAIEGASGYKVFADDDEDPIAELTTETSINLKMLDALDPGTYSITVVALGTTGSTSDSDKSTPVSYTKPEPVVLVLEFGAGAGQTELTNVGTGSFQYLADNTGYTFTYPATGDDVGYGNSYVSFSVDLGAGSKFSDFSAVKATFVGVGGDIGWKHVYLFASATELDAAIASSDGAIGDHNANAANTTAAVATFDISEVDIDSQVVYLAIIFWADNASSGTATSYTISDVTLIE